MQFAGSGSRTARTDHIVEAQLPEEKELWKVHVMHSKTLNFGLLITSEWLR